LWRWTAWAGAQDASELHGVIEEASGNIRAARTILERAAAESPDNFELRDSLCRHLFEHGDPDEAESALKRFVEKSPNNAAALFNLATVRIRRGHYAAAAASYEASLALRPDWPPAYAYLATCYQQLGRPAEANAVLAKANGRPPTRESAAIGRIPDSRVS
jgi:tetratricopeptide (TPR) repeat protein